MTDQPISARPAVRGRPFAKGNGGRRPGSKNQNTLLLAAVMEGEKEEIARKAIEVAKAGNVSMLQFLLNRMWPRERTIRIDLPKMEFAEDAVEALGVIVRAVSEGSITSHEGANLANLINSFSRAIDIADLVKRIDALEARLNRAS